MSVFRYAERIREPLVVNDATHDDRFARDPYFTDVECCSLLAVPILNRGAPSAMLLLENRLIRSAFSTERLDGVMLIAGQLAVSLDNAMVYASLERKVAERTHAPRPSQHPTRTTQHHRPPHRPSQPPPPRRSPHHRMAPAPKAPANPSPWP